MPTTYTPFGPAGDLGFLEALERRGKLTPDQAADLRRYREALRHWGFLERYRESEPYRMGASLAEEGGDA